MTLTEYIIVFGCCNLLLAQCPHFHAIRYINAVATVCTICFSIIAVAMSIYDGEQPRPHPGLCVARVMIHSVHRMPHLP